MIPRARIDIGIRELLVGVRGLVAPAARPLPAWPPTGHVLPVLSARTGFDLLLRALALPPSSEVMLSAVTIPDMARIVRAHGLVPVPLDVPADTLAPGVEPFLRLRTERTSVLVLAHLFGAWCDFRALRAAAQERGVIVVEDCAQAAAAGRFQGDPESDVRLFSFGPIKTETALGGGLAVVRDGALARRMEAIYARDPRQSGAQFASRLARYAFLHALGNASLYSIFVAVCRLARRSHDAVISASTRGFPGPDLLRLIRRQPSTAQTHLLLYRLEHPRADRLLARLRVARELVSLLGDGVARPATRALRHTYWLFPVLVDDPERLMYRLWSLGVDATRGATSLSVLSAPPERPDADPTEARAWMRRLLFVPAIQGMPHHALQVIASEVQAHGVEMARHG